MWYDCTFPLNVDYNNACCPFGNTTSTSSGGRSACILGIGNATDFNECLAERGNVTDIKCFIHDLSNTRPEISSAAVRKPTAVGWLHFACLALLLVGGVSGTYEVEPACTKFVPDGQSEWDLDAEMPHLIISHSLVCSYGKPSPCFIVMEEHRFYFEPLWVADGPDGEVPVTGDFKALDLPADRAFAERVWVPYVPDKFPFPVDYSGLLAVKTGGAVIPGTYTDCKNGTEYRGNISIPEPRGMHYFSTVATKTVATGPRWNESMTTQREE